MCSLFSMSNNACRQAAQLFITIVIILLLGKLITLVPVMDRLHLSRYFNAAEIVWFLSKLAALVVFFLFTRSMIKAIPDDAGFLSFCKGIAEPLSALLIVIMGQALLWQLVAPFLSSSSETLYFSIAIILIVCVSIWLVLNAYRHADHLINATGNVRGFLSGFFSQQPMKCEHCQAEISAKADFCNHCGHKTQDTLCCSQCGEDISEDQLFCPHCGGTLKDNISIDKS